MSNRVRDTKIKPYYAGLNIEKPLLTPFVKHQLDEVRAMIEDEGEDPDSLFVALSRANLDALRTTLESYGDVSKYNYDIYGNETPGISYCQRLGVTDLKKRIAAGERNFFGNVITEINTDENDLRGEDFSAIDFSYCVFPACDFTGADFGGAILRGASFIGCNLADADFLSADLRGAVIGLPEEEADKMSCDIAGAVYCEDTAEPSFYSLEDNGAINYEDICGSDFSRMKFKYEYHYAAQIYFFLKARLHADLVYSGQFDHHQFFGSQSQSEGSEGGDNNEKSAAAVAERCNLELENSKIVRGHVSDDADIAPYLDRYIKYYEDAVASL